MSTASTSRVHNKCRVEQVDTTDRRAHTETRTARDPQDTPFSDPHSGFEEHVARCGSQYKKFHCVQDSPTHHQSFLSNKTSVMGWVAGTIMKIQIQKLKNQKPGETSKTEIENSIAK